MKTTILALSALALSMSVAYADNTCLEGVTTCTITAPDMGDTEQSADNSTSKADQNNTSSNSNPSSGIIAPNNKNANNNDGSVTSNTDGHITGGNTSSWGNKSDIDNTSRVGDTSASGTNKSTNALGQGQSSNNDLSTKDNRKTSATGTNTGGNNKAKTGDVSGTLSGGNNKAKTGDVSSQQQQANANKSTNDLSTTDNRAQKQGQSLSDVGNSLSGSNSSNSMGKSGNSATQTNTSVDASDRSVSNYNSLTYIQPGISHGGIVNLSSPGNISTNASQCGPYVYSYDQRKINGAVVGHLGGITNVPLGYETRVNQLADKDGRPYQFMYEMAPNGDTFIIGSQVISNATNLQVAAAKSISIGGSRSVGENAQFGASNNSGMQQLVLNHTVVPCVYGVIPKNPNYRYTVEELKKKRRVSDIRIQHSGDSPVQSHLTNGIE